MSAAYRAPGESDVAAFARAFDMDPADVRSDTPLADLGWEGSATDWLVVADHLGMRLSIDPVETVETIGDVLAIVMEAGTSLADDSTSGVRRERGGRGGR